MLQLLVFRLPYDEVAGIVATHAHFPTGSERELLTDAAERAFFDDLSARHGTDGAYGHVQATRPDTLAAALNDSPFSRLRRIASSMSRCFSKAFSSASVPNALGSDTPLSVSVARFRRMKTRSRSLIDSPAPAPRWPNRGHQDVRCDAAV